MKKADKIEKMFIKFCHFRETKQNPKQLSTQK